MRRLIRRTITLSPPQAAFLDEEAKRLGLDMAETVRRIVDEHRERKRQQERLDVAIEARPGVRVLTSPLTGEARVQKLTADDAETG